MFNLKPEKMGVIQQITDTGFKKCGTYRFYTSYLKPVPFDTKDPKSYMYGDGEGHNGQGYIPLPDIFKPLQLEGYNQCTINWYRAGYDYIPMHSDSTFKLEDNTDIVVINLLRDKYGSTQFFFEKKKETGKVTSFNVGHGGVVRMSTESQTRFRHAVGLCDTDRIAISFRKLREEE